MGGFEFEQLLGDRRGVPGEDELARAAFDARNMGEARRLCEVSDPREELRILDVMWERTKPSGRAAALSDARDLIAALTMRRLYG